MPLTDEEKQKYIGERDRFKEIKAELLTQINFHKCEISALEKEIEDSRPSTPRGEKICESCDIKGMESMGKGVYRCKICCHEDYYSY